MNAQTTPVSGYQHNDQRHQNALLNTLARFRIRGYAKTYELRRISQRNDRCIRLVYAIDSLFNQQHQQLADGGICTRTGPLATAARLFDNPRIQGMVQLSRTQRQ